MANITIRFGVLLLLLGVASFFFTGSHAFTSLIPAIFGVLLIVLGILARSEDTKRRMLVMHLAATLGLIGFLFPLIRAAKPAVLLLQGQAVAHPRAVQEELVMALICLVFLVLCIRSFIAARRQRLA